MLQEKLAPVLANYLMENGYDFTERGISEEEAKRRFAAYDGLMKLGMTLAGTALGAAAGGANPAQTAASAAGAAWIGVTYNFLDHEEATKRAAAEKKLINCAASDTACKTEAQNEINHWNTVDRTRDQDMSKACASPSSVACQGWYAKLQAAEQSYIGAGLQDYSVWKEKGQIVQQAGELTQRINNAFGYNAGTGILQSVGGGVAGLAELTTLSVKALTGNAQAQDDLKAVANAVGDLMSNPVDTIQQGIKNQIAEANRLEAEGKTDEATQLRSRLITDGILTVTAAGAIVVKGTNTAIKMTDNLVTQGIDLAYLKRLKLDAGAIKGFKSADEVNSLMTQSEWLPAWKQGTAVAETILQPGTKVRMAVSESQYIAIVDGKPAFGGFATFDDIPSQYFAQNQLAITVGDPALGAMKSDLSYVVELRIKQPVSAQVGVVGPQELGSQKLPGGGNQVHFIVARDANKAALFEFIGGKILPK